MESFLKYVAQDIIEENMAHNGGHDNIIDLSKTAVVFPNKRASLFLNEELMKQAKRPIWSPTYITISELFRHHSPLQVADPIKLICDLYKTFVECTNVDETLDHFYGWGQLLLSDFDDIDKNLGDAEQIFRNVENIHELDDDSYLDEEQRKILKKFFANFLDGQDTELKKRFKELWSKLKDIYIQYNTRLEAQGLAYEGALYRKVAEDTNLEFEHETYLFVGFNMMQSVERRLYDQLKSQKQCHFYWDYDKYYVNDLTLYRSHDLQPVARNEAGHYISQYLKEYGNKLALHPCHQDIYDNMSHKKDIVFASASTENIQARYVHQWLMEKKHQAEDGSMVERYKAGRKTAVVLADESLLPTVIHSLPQEVDAVNITLGYPLQQTPFFSLVQQLICLQTIGHTKDKDTYRLRYVSKILRHPYAHLISNKVEDLLTDLENKMVFYPNRKMLCKEGDEGLQLLFSNLEAAENYNLALVGYVVSVLRLIGQHSLNEKSPFFKESLYRTYTLTNRLRALIKSGDLTVDTITLERLIQQLFQSTTIPFHGEPAVGVQIMGVLETRNLDFEHILVLSCNEGNLPKGVNDSSFIPYSIRKAHGLTTIDNKVAIYAYYFNSMLQRAKDITLTYNNATEDGHTGEMSRFMLQLLVESPHKIERWSLTAGQTPQRPDYKNMEKSEEIIEKLNKPRLYTPTFLNTFMRCPKRFYYKYIEELKEPDELEDEIDNRIFGNIFHRAAELFYLQYASASDIQTNNDGTVQLIHPIVITKGEIEQALKHDETLYRLVDRAFREQLFKVTEDNYHPEYNGLQRINREVIKDYLKQLLTIDLRLAPFTILGLELKVEANFDIDTRMGRKTLRMGGFIDRLDAVAANGAPGINNLLERIRVIDYKTGRDQKTHPNDIQSLFDSKQLSKHTDYYLQAVLYSLIVKHDRKLNPANDSVSPALLFIQQSGGENYDPTLKLGKELMLDVETYEKEFKDGLSQLISDIFDPSLPFCPTEDKQRCTICPYAGLCR